MNKLLVYLQIVKHVNNKSTYFTALLHTPHGLNALWPTDGSKDVDAAAEGFHVAKSEKECKVAYTIKVVDAWESHSELAARRVEQILFNRGMDTSGLQVYILNGREPQPVKLSVN